MKAAHKTRHGGHTRHKVRIESREREPLGPLWVITIGMGAFFAVAALVMMVG
jgi:hypothetical protein